MFFENERTIFTDGTGHQTDYARPSMAHRRSKVSLYVKKSYKYFFTINKRVELNYNKYRITIFFLFRNQNSIWTEGDVSRGVLMSHDDESRDTFF